MLGICICYFTISIVMRTKDDFRFVIPYVEFAKQTKGSRPLVLDTSAIVDGRIADLCESRLFDAPVVVPRFVLNELQLIADSADKLKRNRGRRGLDVLKKMQASPTIDVEIDETTAAEIEEAKGVDQKLLLFTKIHNGRLATTDYNLTKVAQVRGVDVVNINDLANSLKVVALPGETMRVRIVKPGEEADQGIGYLDDGTMIVVGRGAQQDRPGRRAERDQLAADLGGQDDLRQVRVLRLAGQQRGCPGRRRRPPGFRRSSRARASHSPKPELDDAAQ